jgi:Iap family predicted aminopeptidase
MLTPYLSSLYTCQQGIASVSCNSTVTVQLDNGYVSTFTEPGVFNNVVYIQATAKVTPITNNVHKKHRLVSHKRQMHEN